MPVNPSGEPDDTAARLAVTAGFLSWASVIGVLVSYAFIYYANFADNTHVDKAVWVSTLLTVFAWLLALVLLIAARVEGRRNGVAVNGVGRVVAALVAVPVLVAVLGVVLVFLSLAATDWG